MFFFQKIRQCICCIILKNESFVAKDMKICLKNIENRVKKVNITENRSYFYFIYFILYFLIEKI